MKRIQLAAVCTAIAFGAFACGGGQEPEVPDGEEAAGAAEEAAEDTGDAMEEAAEDTEEAVEDAEEGAEEAADDAEEAVEEATE